MSLTAEQLASGIQLGYTLYNEGRLEDARILLEGLLTLDPENPYLHLMLASNHRGQERWDDAVIEYSRTLEFFPGEISAWANRGEIYLMQGKLQEAARDLKQAVSLDGGKNDPAAGRAWFLLQMTSGALKLAEEQGMEAVEQAHQQIKLQLK